MYFSSRGTFISRVFPALRWSGLCLGRTSLLGYSKTQHISYDARCFNPLTSPNHRTFRKGMKGTYWPLFVLPSSFFIWTSWSAKEDVKRTWKIINFLNSMCDPFQLLHSFLRCFSATSENWNAWNSPQACQPLNKIQFLIINEIISSAACYTFHTGNWHCETPAGRSTLMKFVLGIGKLKFLTICSVVWRKWRRQQREENVWFLIIFYAPLRFKSLAQSLSRLGRTKSFNHLSITSNELGFFILIAAQSLFSALPFMPQNILMLECKIWKIETLVNASLINWEKYVFDTRLKG